MRTEWMQGYVDALNQKLNLSAYEQSQGYQDGYSTALQAEIEYGAYLITQFTQTKQQAQGDNRDF